MTTPRAFPVATALLALALAGRPCAGESLVTVRVGSQDSCGLGGATSLTWDGKSKQSRLRIDVSRLPRGAEIETARLRKASPLHLLAAEAPKKKKRRR